MLAEPKTRKEIRAALWNPANGRQSSELEIVTTPVLRQRRISVLRGGNYSQVSLHESRQARECGFIETYEEHAVTILRIKRIVSRYYGITVERVESRQKTIPVARPRQIVMFLAREHTKCSLSQIGRGIGGLDHTTILHGARRIKQLMEADAQLAAEIENFERDLGCHRA